MGNGRSSYVGHTDFSNELGITYVDYLQARQFEDSIRFGIREQTKNLIASSTQLAKEGIRKAEQTREAIDKGFTLLSRDLDALKDTLRDGIRELNSTFEWGFSEVLLSLGSLNDTLAELVRVAKTPAQTWAFEQYDIARDEFRRGLYPEALESVCRAIQGYGANPGYKSEFRFHFLLGTIRLGSFANNSEGIVHLAEAETAFRNASRYGQLDHPKDASLALLGAGRAAYANKRIGEAQSYLESALKLDDSSELRFQLSKTLCAGKDWREASKHLSKAIALDRAYAIKAAGDADFQDWSKNLDDLLLHLRNAAKISYDELLVRYEAMYQELKQLGVEKYAMTSFGQDGLSLVEGKLHDAQRAAESNTYFGYREAIDILSLSNAHRTDAVRQFKKAAHIDLQQRRGATQQAITLATKEKEKDRSLFGPTFFYAFIVIEFIGLVSLWGTASKQHRTDMIIFDFFGYALGMTFLMSPLLAAGVALVVSIFGVPIIAAKKAQITSTIASDAKTAAELQLVAAKIDALQ